MHVEPAVHLAENKAGLTLGKMSARGHHYATAALRSQKSLSGRKERYLAEQMHGVAQVHTVAASGGRAAFSGRAGRSRPAGYPPQASSSAPSDVRSGRSHLPVLGLQGSHIRVKLHFPQLVCLGPAAKAEQNLRHKADALTTHAL
jgi:hypothetical protein